MELLLIALVALTASGLTLFSGFGLGTLLLPVFGLFFPIELAIAMTAIVHFLNNLFKLSLFRRSLRRDILLRFGLPAVAGALTGALLLQQLDGAWVLFRYQLAGRELAVTPLKTAIGLLMILFSLFELLPRLKNWTVPARFLPLGGLLSGFFGGLSGHQGALRSAFLLRLQLSKEAFVGTGVAIACLIDVSRLGVYAGRIARAGNELRYDYIAIATGSAFLGAWLGNRLLKKITIATLQYAVALFIIGFALCLMAGII